MTTTTQRRQAFEHKREIRRQFSAREVAEAVGPIVKGIECFGVSIGAWSLIDLITWCLQATGPADCTISTWTVANHDLNAAWKLLTTRAIKKIRFLVDLSFPSRQPSYCAALREAFGDDCIRLSANHAKFTLLRNAEWDLVIRGTANLNQNSRWEWWELSDSKPMADFLEQLVANIFDTQPAQGQFDKRPIEHIQDFQALAGTPTSELRGDVRAYFSNEPFGNDVRRAGLSYLGKVK